MEIKATTFDINQNYGFIIPGERLSDTLKRIMYPVTTHLPGYNLIVGAEYPIVELTGARNGKNWKGVFKLIDAVVVSKDTIKSKRLEVEE